MKKWRFFISALYFCFLLTPAFADVIVLKNGDRLTVEKTEEEGGYVRAKHASLGDIVLPKSEVASITKEGEAPKKEDIKTAPKKGEIIYDRRLAAGYEAQRGNSRTDNFHGEYLWNRNRRWIDEWTLKGSGTQDYAMRKKVTQKYDSTVRYAWSITQRLYNFYRIQGEHDRFENIDLRLTPTAGLGYWLLDTEKTKLMGETGLGYEYEFRRGAKDEGAPILHLREAFSHKLAENIEFGEEIFYFPKLNNFDDYRIQGETFLRFILTKHLAFKLKAADQYRSVPIAGKKKNDLTFTSSIEWLF